MKTIIVSVALCVVFALVFYLRLQNWESEHQEDVPSAFKAAVVTERLM